MKEAAVKEEISQGLDIKQRELINSLKWKRQEAGGEVCCEIHW